MPPYTIAFHDVSSNFVLVVFSTAHKEIHELRQQRMLGA